MLTTHFSLQILSSDLKFYQPVLQLPHQCTVSIGAARLFLKLFQLIGQFANIDYILGSAPLVLAAAASRTLCFTTKWHKYIHHIVFPIDDQTRVAIEAKTDVAIGSRLEDKISILANDLGTARRDRRGSREVEATGVSPSLSLTH